ncbi:MAG: hypothetical protein RJB62_639 [Pseudomonadota bacterium]|jgi:hypothetical protein
MRAHFGGYFLGQVATFVYLLQSMAPAAELDAASWPQFSVYNLVVANFWPLYWLVHFVDREKLDAAYWEVYAAAEGSVAQVLGFFQSFAA